MDSVVEAIKLAFSNTTGMDIKKIASEDGNGFYTFFDMQNVTACNPVYYFGVHQQRAKLEMIKNVLSLKNLRLTQRLTATYKRQFLFEWQSYYRSAITRQLPEALNQLLITDKKKKQIRLLSDLILTKDDFFAFILQSWEIHKFSFSRCVFEHRPKDLENSIYPHFIYKDEQDKIHTRGRTTLTEGQLKLAISERHVVIANFFEKEDKWHCLFSTYKAIGGNESPHIGEPHYHYVSSSWGYSKEQVLNQLSSYRYSLNSLYLKFEGRT